MRIGWNPYERKWVNDPTKRFKAFTPHGPAPTDPLQEDDEQAFSSMPHDDEAGPSQPPQPSSSPQEQAPDASQQAILSYLHDMSARMDQHYRDLRSDFQNAQDLHHERYSHFDSRISSLEQHFRDLQLFLGYPGAPQPPPPSEDDGPAPS